jgi:chromosome segregation ATPase
MLHTVYLRSYAGLCPMITDRYSWHCFQNFVSTASKPRIGDSSLRKDGFWAIDDTQSPKIELAKVKAELSTTLQQLADARSEQGRCFKALQEAHECVSEYHKKLGRMEKSVGHALVVRGEVKDLQGRLDEMTKLNQEHKNMLRAAEQRIHDLTFSEQAALRQASDLSRQVTSFKEQASAMQASAAKSADRTAGLEQTVEDMQNRLKNALLQAEEVEHDRSSAELKRQDALEALADMVELHKQSEEEKAAMQARLDRELDVQQALHVRFLLLFCCTLQMESMC